MRGEHVVVALPLHADHCTVQHTVKARCCYEAKCTYYVAVMTYCNEDMSYVVRGVLS